MSFKTSASLFWSSPISPQYICPWMLLQKCCITMCAHLHIDSVVVSVQNQQQKKTYNSLESHLFPSLSQSPWHANVRLNTWKRRFSGIQIKFDICTVYSVCVFMLGTRGFSAYAVTINIYRLSVPKTEKKKNPLNVNVKNWLHKYSPPSSQHLVNTPCKVFKIFLLLQISKLNVIILTPT